MSVQSEIDRINGNVASTYSALSELGATMPEQRNSDNLPATARTVPAGGADWNAAEGEPGHVLNRTHWSEMGYGFLLPETTVNFSGGQGILEKPVLDVQIGSEYTVTWNGTEYKTVAQRLTNAPAGFEMINGMPALGNFAAVGGANTGEPFIIVCLPEEVADSWNQAILMMALDGSTTATVSVGGIVEIIHKLDIKYLPTPMIINCKDNTADKSFEEICSHLASGGMAYARTIDEYDGTMRNYAFYEMTNSIVKFSYCDNYGTGVQISKIEIDSSGAVDISSISGQL